MTSNLPTVKRRATPAFLTDKLPQNFVLRDVTAQSHNDAPWSGPDITSASGLPYIDTTFENRYIERPKPPGDLHRATPFYAERWFPVSGDPTVVLIGQAQREDVIGEDLTVRTLKMCSLSYSAQFLQHVGWEPYLSSDLGKSRAWYRMTQRDFATGETIFDMEVQSDLYYDALLQAYIAPATGNVKCAKLLSADPAMVSDVDAAAHIQAVSKVSQGDINIGVFIAELPETWRWLATMGYRLVRFISALIRLDFKGALRALRVKSSRKVKRKTKDLAGLDDFVLEFNYAFVPLLSDIYGFVEAVISGLREQGELIHVHSVAFSNENLRGYVGEGRQPKVNFGTYDPADEVAVGVKYDVSFKVIDPNLRTLQELGLLNPWDVIWEKVPFSFLVDWILNLNEIMHSVTAGVGLQFNDGSKTTFRLEPYGYTPGNQQDLYFNFRSWFDQQLTWPIDAWTKDLEVITPELPIGAMLTAEREVLTDFSFDANIDSLRVKLNPFSSVSRVSNFLALLSKALQK